MKKLNLFLLSLLFLQFIACDSPTNEKELNDFLISYNSKFKELYYNASKAEWKLNTMIVDGDTITEKETKSANKALADFTGSKTNIESALKHLNNRDNLQDIQIKQLEKILYMAGRNPESAGDDVDKKISAETAQTKLLFGHTFMLNGKEVSTNQLDSILNVATSLDLRLAAWESSKEVGKSLKDGLTNLRNLRNSCVQALDYKDFFDYEVSDYGMTSDEMLETNRQLIREIWPIYRELHTWARHSLAHKYDTEVPEMIPAHWLPNRWGQDWTGLVNVEGIDIDTVLRKKGKEWICKKAEDFYVSLGMKPLPESFYTLSSLYPLPPNADYKKNNHASAWHMDLDNDLRSLMSIEPNTGWWETTLHELGHIYYFEAYSRPEVPIVLRDGTNRAYHEAMGSLLGLASLQEPFLREVELLSGETDIDYTQVLLKEALNYVVLIPWGAGVMPEFEYSLYAENLSPDEFNAKWWEVKKNIQGIIPPNDRGNEYCDPATKTHINNDPAQYYDYALSYVLLFQLHDHIAKNILNQDPHATNYWGNKEVGDFIYDFMKPGGTVDWREHLNSILNSGISAKPMLEYFEPLMVHLKEVNKGKVHTLPEEPLF